ncbi:MAG: AI-2E family transporter [Candidatus Eremiobacteraeota bacterium]|nr:AI-2E family transporter [Candidatus Eremiobacteraeota bacterium]
MTLGAPAQLQTDRWKPLIRKSVMAGLVLVIVTFLKFIPKTVAVFLVATLIAYGVNPIVNSLSRHLARGAAIAIVYASLFAAVLVTAIVVIPDTITQLQTFFAGSGAYLDATQRLIDHAQAWLQGKFRTQVLPRQFADIESHALAQLSALFNTAVQSVGNIVLSIANVLLIGITAVILSFYLLTHIDDIRESFYSFFPTRSKARVQQLSTEVSRVVGGFMLGQIVLCAFSGIATYAALLLTHSPYALLLGVLTGLFYAVPYLGVFVAILIGFMLGLLKSWNMALLTAAIILVITRIADLMLVPKVMAQSVGISPIAIIFAVFAGGEIFGLWGLVLAIPAAALFKVAWNLWVHPWLTGKPSATFAVEPSLQAEIESRPEPPALQSTARGARS